MNNRFITHLHNQGIIHQVFSPYTPEQNGIVERRHRVIQELGITMLIYANIPKQYWVEAFSTAVFLINRNPTSTLQWD